MTFVPALPFFTGFGLGGSLIIAIGAQNAFVLKQGLRRSHVLAIVLVCALSDTILIWLGAYALSLAVAKVALAATIARYGGAVFLISYGMIAAWKAFANQTMEAEDEAHHSLAGAIAVCLGFTFLNPHVYLDTVVLIGSIGSGYEADARAVFCLGATSASFVWFFSLGYGARLLVPIFRRPIAWRSLEAIIASVMFILAAQIILGD